MADPRKKDLSPSVLDFGPVRFKLARHFGFCYGVENAIEIAYKALDEANDRRVFLLSEMIHNPHVNEDLLSRGIRFLRTTSGEQIIPFDELSANDIVIIPAFGTTLETENRLREIGVDVEAYDTTCPFVEGVDAQLPDCQEELFRSDPRKALPRRDAGHVFACTIRSTLRCGA